MSLHDLTCNNNNSPTAPESNTAHYVTHPGRVNAVMVKAQFGSKAHRYHVRITLVSDNGMMKCLTEKISKDAAKKELPISFQESRVNYHLLSAAYEATNHFGVPELQLVYDNRTILYTPTPIILSDNKIVLSPDAWGSAREYIRGVEVIVEIIPSKLGALDLNDRRFFEVGASSGREDHDLRSFYELLATQGAQDKGTCVTVGRECFAIRNTAEYSHGITFIKGFKKNARIVQMPEGPNAMKLVVDPVESVFYTEQYLATSFEAVFEATRCDDYMNPRVTEFFMQLYRNVRVNLVFDKSHIFLVRGLSEHRLRDLTFKKDDQVIRVVDHFETTHSFKTRAQDMPALKVVFSSGRHGYYPLDALIVVQCQKVPMAKFPLIRRDFHDVVLKRNAVKPQERYHLTEVCFGFIRMSSELFDSFGVEINHGHEVNLRYRTKPAVITGTGNIFPNDRTRFPMKDHKYIEPAKCKKWVILNGTQNEDLKNFVNKLTNEARSRGLNLPPPMESEFRSRSALIGYWSDVFSELVANEVDYVMLIDSRKTLSHPMLKVCELIFGIQTQHVNIETVAKPSAIENILAKVNMKMNGLNYHVKMEPNKLCDMFEEDKIFVLGYDVAHPPPSTERFELSPSIVGISYNAARQYQSFNGNYFFQAPRQESVDADFLCQAVMCGLRMRRLHRINAPDPEVVVVFRDGLSEGQMLMAKHEELPAIQESCNKFFDQHIPVIMVLATKRHNRRFYTFKHENVAPGTVVVEGIARAGAEEFYMQSAYPLQGTAKLTDYEVIHNDTKFSLNDIQAFTHGMCYTHQIVTSAVSLPEPVYQAHELAKRGRNNYMCYSNISSVPHGVDGIDYVQLNKKFTYLENSLILRRFTA